MHVVVVTIEHDSSRERGFVLVRAISDRLMRARGGGGVRESITVSLEYVRWKDGVMRK